MQNKLGGELYCSFPRQGAAYRTVGSKQQHDKELQVSKICTMFSTKKANLQRKLVCKMWMGMKLHCEKMTSLHEPCFQSGHCNSCPVASDKKAAHSTVDHGLHELFLVVENAYLQISVFPKARHDLCFYSIASGYPLSPNEERYLPHGRQPGALRYNMS